MTNDEKKYSHLVVVFAVITFILSFLFMETCCDVAGNLLINLSASFIMIAVVFLYLDKIKQNREIVLKKLIKSHIGRYFNRNIILLASHIGNFLKDSDHIELPKTYPPDRNFWQFINEMSRKSIDYFIKKLEKPLYGFIVWKEWSFFIKEFNNLLKDPIFLKISDLDVVSSLTSIVQILEKISVISINYCKPKTNLESQDNLPLIRLEEVKGNMLDYLKLFGYYYEPSKEIENLFFIQKQTKDDHYQKVDFGCYVGNNKIEATKQFHIYPESQQELATYFKQLFIDLEKLQNFFGN